MILIIDDDSAIRSSLSFMLKRAKYDVQAVPGPKEAIEIVRSVAPQLILMDMNFTLSTSGEEGLTLLWVSHQEAQVRRVASRVLGLRSGAVVFWDRVEKWPTGGVV